MEHPIDAYDIDYWTLDEKLENYYEQRSVIEPTEFDRVFRIYEKLKSILYIFLSEHLQLDIDIFIDRGSASEGLKVSKPDEFDVLIPLKLSGLHWDFEDFSGDPSFVRIIEVKEDPCIPSKFKQDGCLSAARVRSSFQGAIQKCVSNFKLHSKDMLFKLTRASTHGPAITLDLYVPLNNEGRVQLLFSVDLVPLVILGNTWLVAKPHPDSDFMMLERQLWRRSFAQHEHDYAMKLPDEYKKVFKIIKTLRLNNNPMDMLPSFVYKVSFLRWYHTKEDRSSTISDRVVSFLRYFASEISSEELYPFPRCEYNGNLLKSYTNTSLLNLASYIRKLASSESNYLRLKMAIAINYNEPKVEKLRMYTFANASSSGSQSPFPCLFIAIILLAIIIGLCYEQFQKSIVQIIDSAFAFTLDFVSYFSD
ncbi:hypothetical protein CAPTEDRAFT_189394 [Capitella teleta]|uniref:Mab-21-like nucleotidyltransferase domain-containing protein n=1 Tax=Capitella teleta TaxID=283909 RepID=R7UQI8_CAPTE|nr:hypothetical protein CAPTEDRAFT_189394 [Capitella teleta]|eukprot:ELU08455.1 hypothetical protein CAPTEDRAFT_189394 [Capitella teleta]